MIVNNFYIYLWLFIAFIIGYTFRYLLEGMSKEEKRLNKMMIKLTDNQKLEEVRKILTGCCICPDFRKYDKHQLQLLRDDLVRALKIIIDYKEEG